MHVSESVVARIRCVSTSGIDSSFTDERRLREDLKCSGTVAVQVGENLEEKRRFNETKSKFVSIEV